MKSKINFKNRLLTTWQFYMQRTILITLILTGVQTSVQAQEVKLTKPSWWFGAAAGANFNFYRGTTQQLNSALTVPAAFHDGFGAGLYFAPLAEYHFPDSKWGIMLQAGYDNRSGSFNQILTPCNCPADLAADLSYITIEPSLRFAPFKSGFYLFGGPRLGITLTNSFTYKQGINPAYPEQTPVPDVKGDFSDAEKMLISMQIGAGYDISLSAEDKRTQFVLSPFVSFHPYFGQSPRSTETWNLTTLRAGVAFKFGHKVSSQEKDKNAAKANIEAIDSKVEFTVHAPKNIPAERMVKETFPLRNYVFFDVGSTEIPERYVLLKKNQVKDFKEEQLEGFKPKKASGRSAQQMVVYYNILNILGNRMGKNPSSTIKLVGSSEKGAEEGQVMAESVKQYLVNIFSIDASRIATEGRDKPKLPSEQPGATRELELLREGDRRVSIESSSTVLLMEFRNGADAPLKPVEIIATQEAPLDSYVSFTAAGQKDEFTFWSLEIKDKNGKVKNFGPYTQETVSIPGKSILGTTPEGDYKVTMIGVTKEGKMVKKETSVHMVLWTPPKNKEGMRFSVIFEFNQSTAINMYKKYLTEIIVPKIPDGGIVMIHGYSDIIGNENHNRELSLARANGVRKVIEKGLMKAGKTNITFEVYAFGEDETLSLFENKFPEERFYNRTVVIDIIYAR